MTASKAFLSMVVFTVYARLFMPAESGALRADRDTSFGSEPFVSANRLRSMLPEGFDRGILGIGKAASEHLDELRAALAPLFAALPKDKLGGLGQMTVRYAMHRFLAQRRGLAVRGLEPGGVSWSASASWNLVPNDQVAAFLHTVIEQSLQGRIFGLQELSLLALALERLMDAEAADRLESALQVHKPPSSASEALSEAEADAVLVSYMEGFILGRGHDAGLGLGLDPDLDVAAGPRSVEEAEVMGGLATAAPPRLPPPIADFFPGWNQAEAIARSALNESFAAKGRRSLSTPEVARVAALASQRLAAAFHGVGCPELKSSMLRLEDGRSGRVALPNFYKVSPSSNWSWHFQEGRDYLRALGALDETAGSMARVVVSNYVTAEPNCIADSGYIALCCPSECDALFHGIEQEVAAPEAAPALLVGIVEGLNSSTVDAPRKLSETMRQRLEKVATRHGGVVPLHGSLFAQWMHHAFPRECPYPRVPGTTATTTDRRASDAAAASHHASLAALSFSATDPSPDFAAIREDLRGSRRGGRRLGTNMLMEVCRCAVLLVALTATSVGLFRTVRTALLTSGIFDEDKAD